jgi:hypothetical protein
MRWLEAVRENPAEAGELLWFMRGMGAICLTFALMFAAGGVARMTTFG